MYTARGDPTTCRTPSHPLAALTTPDEDPAELAALIAALTAKPPPRTHLEGRQVELIADTDWVITRHRRQSAQRLVAAEAKRVRSHVAREEQSRQLASQSRNSKARARAHANSFNFHARHEYSIERLEARRRQLLRDYCDLKAPRSRKGNRRGGHHRMTRYHSACRRGTGIHRRASCWEPGQ